MVVKSAPKSLPKKAPQTKKASGNGKSWGGGKGGGAAGQWLFVPAGGFGGRTMMPMMPMFGKGQGKAGMQSPAKQKTIEKLKKVDSSCKVWVGNLPKKVTWKELEKHFESVAKPVVTDISEKKNGTGVVAFKTAEDAELAIATLAGSELGGVELEIDSWTKSEKSDKPQEKKNKTKKKNKSGAQTAAKKKTDPKILEKLKAIDPSCKVWVGGLSEKTNWQKLQQHFTELASKPAVVDVTNKGKAVVAYETAEEADSAITLVNGTDLDGATIETDVWVKPEKKKKEDE